MSEPDPHPLLTLIRKIEEVEPGFIETLLDPVKLQAEVDKIMAVPLARTIEEAQKLNFPDGGGPFDE